MMWDEKRFVPLNEFLSVEVAAVYIKNAAILKASGVLETYPADKQWIASPRTAPSGKELAETVKLYLVSDDEENRLASVYCPAVRFSIPTLDPRLDEDFFEIRIARSENVRAVCAPRPLDEEYREQLGMNSEEFEEAGKKFWGFGLEHPYKGSSFESHKRIAGPLVDYWRFYQNPDWKFKPVFVKVQDGDVLHYYRIMTNTSDISAEQLRLEDVPPELIAYDLGGKRQKVAWRGEKKVAAPDSFEASAAIRRFVKK